MTPAPAPFPANSAPLFPATECLSDRDYLRLADFIHRRSGIRLPPSKKTLLEGRLRRRLRHLALSSFQDYCRFLFEQGGCIHEEAEILNLVTTNKTDFFREPHHFEALIRIMLPALAETGAGRERPLRVWSAGCSNGAEPYTLAMVCEDFASRHRGYRYGILATDICTDVLQQANRAIYPHAMIEAVPMELRQRHLLRCRDGGVDEVRISRDLRQRVSFDYLNLMDETYPFTERFDIIFCRNVLIYFDKPTQRAVIERLCRHLRAGGYLVLGHSESIAGMALPLTMIAPTAFRLEPGR